MGGILMERLRYPTKAEAIINLVGGGIITIEGSDEVEYVDGQTPPSEAEIDAELVKIQAEYDSQEYARNRQADYPDWGTQLNKIYDDGLTKWKSEMVDPVKTKWPKDNSGPV